MLDLPWIDLGSNGSACGDSDPVPGSYSTLPVIGFMCSTPLPGCIVHDDTSSIAVDVGPVVSAVVIKDPVLVTVVAVDPVVAAVVALLPWTSSSMMDLSCQLLH